MNPRKKMRPMTIHLPENWIEKIEEARKRLGMPNRAETIRYAIRELIKEVTKDEPHHR